MRWPSGDRGSIAPLVPIVLFAVLLLGGLVVDGSSDLNARSQAQAYAEEAARAGATAVDLSAANLTLVTDGGARSVQRRVDAYCTALRHSDPRVTSCELASPSITDAVDTGPNCPAGPQHIVVNARVRMRISTTLLGIIGIAHMSATGTAQARPYEGTNAADAC
jgi:hypothetical protein